MTYLNDYLSTFENKGQHELAESIKRTSSEVGAKHLSNFDYHSNQIGLLFGNIQSGKTGQVFGIACEAADLGFPFFILLTTDNKLLQEQTYKRALKDLTDFVVCSEADEQKFRSHGNKPVMVVLKKNVRVLKEWASIFKNTAALSGNPLFVIDDEADAASLNTKVNQDKVSSINKYLAAIRSTALSSIYLQVTGTPQALLLQTMESDWQPSFTQYFEPGKSYLGGDFFFPNTSQTPSLVHFVDTKTPTEVAKEVALRHLIVSAQTLLAGLKVSNCLIHPGTRQSAHAKAREEIEKGIVALLAECNSASFQQQFDKEYDSMNPVKSKKQPRTAVFNKVMDMLQKHDFSVIVLNGTSTDDESDYQSGCNFVIGGTNLGRGVTFGQLNTFYYTRTSKTPQADTMWQHSRMFGYDRDPGLVSFYSSRALYKLFTDINVTNNSIINQVKRNGHVTIAYPDGLNPTRKNVLDKSILNIMVGGSNHFPIDPRNNTFKDITDLLAPFKDNQPATEVNLHLILQILSHFGTEKSFNLKGYTDMINATLSSNTIAQGRLLVRRNRDITKASRALLSPNDWAESNKYKNQFVLTVYGVIGSKDKGWDGKNVWVPNIKLPEAKSFFII